MIGNAFRSAYDSDIMKRNTRYDAREEYRDEQGYEDQLKQPEARIQVKNSVVSMAIEQQHLLDELNKCIEMLGERLLPISVNVIATSQDISKEPKREESEMYRMLSGNNSRIVQLIYSVNAIREGVQL